MDGHAGHGSCLARGSSHVSSSPPGSGENSGLNAHALPMRPKCKPGRQGVKKVRGSRK